jgi:hypothetical protein
LDPEKLLDNCFVHQDRTAVSFDTGERCLPQEAVISVCSPNAIGESQLAEDMLRNAIGCLGDRETVILSAFHSQGKS